MIGKVEGPAMAKAEMLSEPHETTLANASISGGATLNDLRDVFIASASNEEEGKEAFDNFMMMIYRSIIRKLR